MASYSTNHRNSTDRYLDSGYATGFKHKYEYSRKPKFTNMAYSQNRGGYSQNNQQTKKRSGAKMKSAKNGNMVVVAWKATKFGMLSILCAPTKYTKKVTSKSGRVWHTGYSVSIVNKNTGASNFAFGMMEAATGKVIVKSIGWVINPHGGYGGVVAKIGGRPRR